MNSVTDKDIEWTNPLYFPEFRRKFFGRVYMFLAFQFGISAIMCYTGKRFPVVHETLKTSNTYAYGTIGLFVLSYILLCVKKLNNFTSIVASALMQIVFTVFLVLFFIAISITFHLDYIEYALLLVTISCFFISFCYLFLAFEYNRFQGIRFIFYFQILITGILMLSNAKDTNIQNSVTGLCISALIMLYLGYGTIQLTLCKFVKFSMNNFIYGVTLIYTFFVIGFYYQKSAD